MYIDKSGDRWYKGNLHTHTTRSDGVKTPEEVKALYKSMDYDFIALTDHRTFGEGDERDPSGLLVLSGVEYDFGDQKDVAGGLFHILSVGAKVDPAVDYSGSPQDAVDAINEAGGLAILAHPAWSFNSYDMILPFKNLFATEIFNSISDMPFNCRPYSGIVIDQLAARGYYLPLVATDDSHFYKGEAGVSAIYVNLGQEPLCRESLLRALREERFIATCGPIFECLREGDEIVVKCYTPATAVCFFTNLPYELHRSVSADGDTLTEARFTLHDGVTFVRPEIIGKDGKIGYGRTFLV